MVVGQLLDRPLRLLRPYIHCTVCYVDHWAMVKAL